MLNYTHLVHYPPGKLDSHAANEPSPPESVSRPFVRDWEWPHVPTDIQQEVARICGAGLKTR